MIGNSLKVDLDIAPGAYSETQYEDAQADSQFDPVLVSAPGQAQTRTSGPVERFRANCIDQ